jgi:hypothetical protein
MAGPTRSDPQRTGLPRNHQYGVGPFEEAAKVDLDSEELKKALKAYKRPKDSVRGRLKKMLKEYAVQKQLGLMERGNKFYVYGKGGE